jgi:diguanylate cyclase (GGDEF)-like protein/PAS domain S-box-containing protein
MVTEVSRNYENRRTPSRDAADAVWRGARSAAHAAADLALGWHALRQKLPIRSFGAISHPRDRAVDAMRDGVVVLDASWRIMDVNPAASRLLGRSHQTLLGVALSSVLPALGPLGDLEQVGKRPIDLTLGMAPFHRYCQAHLAPIGGVTVASTGWLLTLHDATSQKLAETALEESERRYRGVVDSLSEIIFQTDANRRLTLLNPAWTAVTGCTVAETLGTWINDYIHPDDRRRDDQEAGGLLDGSKELARYELRFLRQDGDIHWLEVHARPLTSAEGTIVGITGTLVDVTDRKLLAEQLLHRAFHDALTGLANRTLFIERVTHTLARAGRVATAHAVLFLDLDNFKKVNDSLGHAAGDDLLRGVAHRLVSSVRGSDTVARLGGDEFAILLEDLVQQDHAFTTTERILETLREPILVQGKEVFVGASIGVTLLSRNVDSADTLLRNADIAMYAAKRQGRGRYVVFSDGMDTATRHRLELEADLYRAIGRDELVAMYQPTVEVGTGRIIGAEALVRWQHPTRGLIHPAEFIGIAEETGLIVAIGKWVLQKACRDGRRWQKSNPSHAGLSVAVNISARQLQDAQLVEDVAAILEECLLDPASLILEITESVAMRNTEATIARLGALKALGVRLAIDDFGTGYSSLSYLQRFPIDILKIDRAFVKGIAENDDDEALAHTIVQLARTLRLKTVAEGIETNEQLERLRALGCDYGQGYYFARPMPGEQLAAMLAGSSHLAERDVA